MDEQKRDLDEFLRALEQHRESRQKLLEENPEKEQNRLKWIEFQKTIETAWVPVCEEFLTVLGRLWFGETMRLSGPMFRKKLVPVPAFVVTHQFFGPMAVFWVQEDEWKEREVPFTQTEEKTELKTEIFRLGYRCRMVLQENGEYHFQNDNHETLVQFGESMQVNREQLVDIFAEAYLEGPKVIHNRWKEVDWSRISE